MSGITKIIELEATIAAQVKEIRKLQYEMAQKFVNTDKFKDMSAELTNKDRQIKWLKLKKMDELYFKSNTKRLKFQIALEKIKNSRTVSGPVDERLEVIMELKETAEQALTGE